MPDAHGMPQSSTGPRMRDPPDVAPKLSGHIPTQDVASSAYFATTSKGSIAFEIDMHHDVDPEISEQRPPTQCDGFCRDGQVLRTDAPPHAFPLGYRSFVSTRLQQGRTRAPHGGWRYRSADLTPTTFWEPMSGRHVAPRSFRHMSRLYTM